MSAGEVYDQDMSDCALFSSTLLANTERYGLQLTPGPVEQMWDHLQLLREANRHVNLTRVVGSPEAAAKHYADTLSVIPWLARQQVTVRHAVDVGSGGGFPAIPLAICCPEWQVTAIDGTGKKIRLVQDFAAALGLKNLEAIHIRAEQWPKSERRFDLALFRAIGSLKDCLQIARPLITRGGIVVCYKGGQLPKDERTQAQQYARRSGWQPLPAWFYRLSYQDQVIQHQLCGFGRP